MAKRQAKAKVQHPTGELRPLFEPSREFGSPSPIGATLISDAGGRLWTVDAGSGSARPIKFFDK